MNQKQIVIFVIVLFSVIAILITITQNRKVNVSNEIVEANLNQIENVCFYKDFLRNNGDLNLPITAQADLKSFLKALKTIKSTSHSLKSLNTEVLYRIRMNLKVSEDRFLTINIYKSAQTGKLGIISIDQGDVNVFPCGTYESEELLTWVQSMEQRENFKMIGIRY